MRVTVKIEDTLYKRALQLAEPGIGKTDLFREVLRTFVQVQSAKRLAALGGTAPAMEEVQRRP